MPSAYGLENVQRLIAAGEYAITRTAAESATAMGFDEAAIRDCIAALRGPDYRKTLPARPPFPKQDVYKTVFEGVRVYLKVQIGPTGKAAIVSFKEDTG